MVHTFLPPTDSDAMATDSATEAAGPIRTAYEQANRALKTGDIEEAELICRRALPQHGRDGNLLCLLGEICLRQKRPQEAKQFFFDALGRHPGYPRALEGLGLALLADGNPARAIRYLRQVVEVLPRREKARAALVRALAEAGHQAESESEIRHLFEIHPRQEVLNEAEKLLGQGRLDEGEKRVRALLEKDPGDLRALRMLATLAIEANRFRAARSLLERALAIEPAYLPALNELANLLTRQDRYDEALNAVDRALNIDPQLVQTWITRGNVMSRAQRFEAAIEAYEKALEISDDHPGALSGLGHVLKTIGRRDDAVAVFRRSLKAHPRYGEVYWSLANLKTFEFEPGEVTVMETMIADENLRDEARVNFLFSLGKHYENTGDFDRAFEHYRRGNTLRRAHEVYDPVQTQLLHDRLIEVFSRQFLSERSGSGHRDASPILIVGLPRSGSTLIEQILASHSAIEGTMELPDLSRLSREIGRRGGRRMDYPEAVRELDVEALSALGRRYIEDTARFRSGRLHFIDKMPNNFPHVGLLHLMLPGAKIINARRHPLDSCLGTYKQLFFNGQSFSYDLFELGHYYLQYQRLMDHWHDVLPGKVLDVQYEDMVDDQEGQTRRILDYLGLPWEDSVLRFYETERAVNTASSEQVRQPIYTGSLNFWRNYERHLGELIGVLEPLLRSMPASKRPESIMA
jgi:tetratricopeptide (TPR) repeat protein